MKKVLGIMIVCLFFIVVIFVGKHAINGGKKREYVKSVEYYEENIENIDINEVSFRFLQVDEVVNINEAFYKKYGSCKKVVVKNDTKSDIFEEYTNIEVDEDCVGIRCYLNEEEGPIGAYFRYTFFEMTEEDLLDFSIEVCVTTEPLEGYQGLLPIKDVSEGSVYSIYDNILYYMENDENMNLFRTNICTAVCDGSKHYYFYGGIVGEKEYYINKYCNIIYNFLNQICK